MSITVAMSYIAFWTVLFAGLGLWIKKVKYRAISIAPALFVVLILLFTIIGPVFANNNYYQGNATEVWDPIPNDPIGTPQGVKPGRVVWIWDKNATDWDTPIGTEDCITDCSSYWWYKEYNNQTVVDNLYSLGLQALTDATDDYPAWDSLFKHFNQEHGNGNVGYKSGEKIAIKINLNNNYGNSYSYKSNYIDANPYVVKALLRQLVNVVGVRQEDITVYDASRKIGNWFYNRVYYEEYPATPPIPEFSKVIYADRSGGSGRTLVVASSKTIHFVSAPTKLLPTCVTKAKYLINIPCIKIHTDKERVTLTGKNFFGTWVGSIGDVHNYLFSGESKMGNPAPQTDLMAHEELGKKTLLVIGDGTYGCHHSNAYIERYQMYPFNDDWMSSLFFSQDQVALDSVMYDFLHTETIYPSEGAQNYLHQAADPPTGTYDPEGDGTYLSHSLGVHEHWNKSVDIFSSDRYSGPDRNGIEFIAIIGGKLKADADGPYYGQVDQIVQFTGFASGGSPPYHWEWDFGDGNSSDEQKPTHTYTYPGNFTVTLTVTDDSDHISYDYTWAWIQVSNNPPNKPNIDGPVNGRIRVEYNYTFNTTDPDENNIWYYISWGDKEIIYIYGPYPSGKKITLPYSWSEKGSYTITCKARDVYNEESDLATLEVTMPYFFQLFIHPVIRRIQNLFSNHFPIIEYLRGLYDQLQNHTFL